MIKLKDILNEGKSTEITYKGKTYYIPDDDYHKPTNKQFFLYTDKNLKDVAKVGGKTLMVKKKDIEYKIK